MISICKYKRYNNIYTIPMNCNFWFILIWKNLEVYAGADPETFERGGMDQKVDFLCIQYERSKSFKMTKT